MKVREELIILEIFHEQKLNVMLSIPQDEQNIIVPKHIPSRFVTLIPSENDSSQVITRKIKKPTGNAGPFTTSVRSGK